MEALLSRAGRDAKLVLLGLLLGIGLTPRADDKPRVNFEPARKVTLDTGYADCRSTSAPNGQYYQEDQDHSQQLKAGCGTGGFSIARGPWTFGLHYVDLGTARTEATAIAFEGDDKAQFTAGTDPFRAECAAGIKGNCAYQFRTSNKVYGFNFSAARELFTIGEVRFDGKAGLYVHRLILHAQVEPTTCRDNCPWTYRMEQAATRITPTWGAVVRWKYFFASWEAYENIGVHSPVTAGIKGRTEVKTVGVSIPL